MNEDSTPNSFTPMVMQVGDTVHFRDFRAYIDWYVATHPYSLNIAQDEAMRVTSLDEGNVVHVSTGRWAAGVPLRFLEKIT